MKESFTADLVCEMMHKEIKYRNIVKEFVLSFKISLISIEIFRPEKKGIGLA